MEFLIEVCESVRKIVRVVAEDEQAACAMAEVMYDNGKIDMEKDVVVETEFTCRKRGTEL